MKLSLAMDMIVDFMDMYDLFENGWDFEINRSKRIIGLCNHATNTLLFSSVYIELNKRREVKDTILHEIAHALVGPEEYDESEGHDLLWQAVAKGIGARPDRFADRHIAPKPRWYFVCPVHGSIGAYFRKPKLHRKRLVWCAVCHKRVAILDSQSGKKYKQKRLAISPRKK